MPKSLLTTTSGAFPTPLGRPRKGNEVTAVQLVDDYKLRGLVPCGPHDITDRRC